MLKQEVTFKRVCVTLFDDVAFKVGITSCHDMVLGLRRGSSLSKVIFVHESFLL